MLQQQQHTSDHVARPASTRPAPLRRLCVHVPQPRREFDGGKYALLLREDHDDKRGDGGGGAVGSAVGSAGAGMGGGKEGGPRAVSAMTFDVYGGTKIAQVRTGLRPWQF